ncbi:hypothetical protein GE061_018893 [Apolygus lucorum]|uniref:Amidophosphoribosyltransferase n=1 Tax=Apolygus lucorum TaxID=248454 RepID=A0A8S9X6W4_APOLU|nr:hypothetical protein GE061_018893 [Apolygus lucorum]
MAAGPWPTSLDVGQVICLGLVALQHRGQESAGIVTSEGTSETHLNVKKGMGMINTIFNDENMKKLKGNLGIGHTRYSTSAASEEVNCQPFVVHTVHGVLAVAHNGELVNCDKLRKQVLSRGVGLSTHSDSELITQALCLNPPDGEEDNGPDWPARIKHLMQLAPLSYSLVIMMKDRIFGVRDAYGNRPLCLGKIVALNGSTSPEEGWVISSESCGFLSIGARYVREVQPGEIIEITNTGFRTVDIVERPENRSLAFCIFEYVYFARSDTIFEGQMVYSVRMECGKMLAREAFVEADIISSVPESGTAAAHGFSREAKIPFAEVLCKNRGNTIGPIVKLLKDAGAKAVHVRIASPPLRYPCFMGINIPTSEELIANKLDNMKLATHTGADSLAYLSVDGLKKAVRLNIKNTKEIGHCTACLTGEYPEPLEWILSAYAATRPQLLSPSSILLTTASGVGIWGVNPSSASSWLLSAAHLVPLKKATITS